MLMDSNNTYICVDGADPAGQVNLSTGTITYLVTDSLGSVRGAVNSSGTLTGATNYDAWGSPESAGGLTATTPFGYVGGYTDSTGLIYLINRYYDPAAGQFMSLDPAITQTLQPYVYANGDPVVNRDPTGAAPRPWMIPHWKKHIDRVLGYDVLVGYDSFWTRRATTWISKNGGRFLAFMEGVLTFICGLPWSPLDDVMCGLIIGLVKHNSDEIINKAKEIIKDTRYKCLEVDFFFDATVLTFDYQEPRNWCRPWWQ
jgi:RHS repeat-associated protein